MPRSTTAITARNRAADAPTTKNSTTISAAAAAAETAELLVDRYKTSLCKKYTVENGCPYEERCMFAHGKAELRTRAMNVADGLTTEEAVKVHQRKHRKNLRKPENASSPKKASNNKTKDAKAETTVETTTTTKPAAAATAVTTTPTAAGRSKPVSINTGKPLFADIVAAKKQQSTAVVVAPSTPSAASDCGASSSDDEAASPYYYSYTHNPYAFNCLGVERAE